MNSKWGGIRVCKKIGIDWRSFRRLRAGICNSKLQIRCVWNSPAYTCSMCGAQHERVRAGLSTSQQPGLESQPVRPIFATRLSQWYRKPQRFKKAIRSDLHFLSFPWQPCVWSVNIAFQRWWITDNPAVWSVKLAFQISIHRMHRTGNS